MWGGVGAGVLAKATASGCAAGETGGPTSGVGCAREIGERLPPADTTGEGEATGRWWTRGEVGEGGAFAEVGEGGAFAAVPKIRFHFAVCEQDTACAI